MTAQAATVALLALCCAIAPAREAYWMVGQHGSVNHGQPGYLGIDVCDAGQNAGTARDVHGAEITRVDHDAPAGRMGLRLHDVVVQLNGVAISGERQFRKLLQELTPGHSVTLLVSREGQQVSVSGQLVDRVEMEKQVWERHVATVSVSPGPQAPSFALPGEDPPAEQAPAVSAAPSIVTPYGRSFLRIPLTTPTYTGLMLEMLGPQLADFLGIPGRTGLLVHSVNPNSPAAMAGMRAGDVVVRTSLRGIVTMSDWTKAVHQAKGRPLEVTIVRDRQEKTLTLMADSHKHSRLEFPDEVTETPAPVQLARLTEL